MRTPSATGNPPSDMAYVALGSNLGNSREMVRCALEQLQALSVEPLRRSSLWQSSPVDCPPDSPAFVNAAAALKPRPRETPESLLTKLRALERRFGRRPKLIRNEPRPLDLDLIAFGGERRGGPRLTLPHPRAHQRRFVLAPLAEVAPDLVLPGQSQTVRQLLERLDSAEIVLRLSD